MTLNQQDDSQTEEGRTDAANWASDPRFKVGELPSSALNLNVEGRTAVGPLQGFGQLWLKTHNIRMQGGTLEPADVVKAWKENFPRYQPPENRFYPSVAGVKPGEVVVINASVAGMGVSTGVMVLYADDESFTLMTPEGHPESGWITFSARRDGDDLIAEVQSYARANDPIYELGFRFLGGSKFQDKLWAHVLRSLASDLDLDGDITSTKVCLDGKLQWREAKNVWQNAGIRTTLYKAAAPVRWVRRTVSFK